MILPKKIKISRQKINPHVVTLFHRPTPQTTTEVQYVDSIEKLSQIFLTRKTIKKFFHLAFFREIVLGCFVKIGGCIAVTNKQKSCIAKITDAAKMTPECDFGKVKTKKGLMLGDDGTMMSMRCISNKRISKKDFVVWKKTFTDHGLPLPTMDQVWEKQRDIQKALDYVQSSHPLDLAKKRIELLAKRSEACYYGNIETAKEISGKMKELDDEAVDVFNNLNKNEYQNRKRGREMVGVSYLFLNTVLNNYY